MLNFLCATERSFSRHQTLITAIRSESESTSTKIEQTRHLWRPGLRNWGLLKGHRMPAPSEYTLWMLELWLLQNHPRKALFKIKTPLWSAESTSANIAPRDWSRWASAAGRAGVVQRCLWAATTGDLTACGYCSFQVTKFDKKLTSVT